MTALQFKLVLVLAAALLFAGGEWAWSAHERAIGARDAKIAAETDSAHSAMDTAHAWQDRAAAAAARADSLENILKRDSAVVAELELREPTVVKCQVSTAPGKPPVLTDVVSKADYDALVRSAAQQSVDASRAIAAKNSVIRADSARILALEQLHHADSVIAVTLKGPTTSFWSSLKPRLGVSAIYAIDDHRLHWGPSINISIPVSLFH